jgi:hypothetical protein
MKKNKNKLENIAKTYYEKQLIKTAIKEKKLQFILIK